MTLDLPSSWRREFIEAISQIEMKRVFLYITVFIYYDLHVYLSIVKKKCFCIQSLRSRVFRCVWFFLKSYILVKKHGYLSLFSTIQNKVMYIYVDRWNNVFSQICYKEYIILSINVSIQCFGNMKVFKGSTTWNHLQVLLYVRSHPISK